MIDQLPAASHNIRSNFPALSRHFKGRPVAYFDSPGGTQIAKAAIDGMLDYLVHHNANTHWTYPSSEETDQTIAAARAAMVRLLNAASSDEIVFGANMTTLTLHLSRALGRQCAPGDEIVVTELDHHANVDPWYEMARDYNLVVKKTRMTPSCEIDYDDLHSKISARTRIVAIGAASNAFGTINDVEAMVRAAKRVGALTIVDAVHYASHECIDVRRWDCDFLLCSSYKFYGPHLGILYGKRKLLAQLDVPKLLPAANTPPESWETGTQNHEGIAGLAKLVDFMTDLSEGATPRERIMSTFARLATEGHSQLARLWNGIGDIPNARVFGVQPSKKRTPTLSFEIENVSSQTVARHLREDAIFASHGDFYAQTAVQRVSSGGSIVRLGCAWYTTDDEVERVLSSLRRLRKGH
ncbi:MAG: cysteine desulfurase-like protein [Candidatus Eremiobacteraeota bacterium]|nr:cysteine desulfurase-like protein [Candidatus Eremiobacteraeota bacterium]